MYQLKMYRFGFADAETEYQREPETLEQSFYDPMEIVPKLTEDFPFLLVGRKGNGKTAVAAKLRLMAKRDPLLICTHVSLENFEFKTFSKLGSAQLSGGSRFTLPWRFMLLLQAVSIARELELTTSALEFLAMCKQLDKYGLLARNGISKVIRTVAKPGFKIGFKGAELELAGAEVEHSLADIEDIMETLERRLVDVDFEESRLLIIVDGLDDSLRSKDRQLDIVSGLIRAANGLNDNLYRQGVPIKFLVLARPDVLNLCNDPDLNKILSDSKLELSWYRDVKNPLNSDLMELLRRRFQTAGPWPEDCEPWYAVFPKTLMDKDSWQYILEHTLLRPRDILQFLKECQKLYPEMTSLTPKEALAALTNYSETYFIGEMKNELAGFMSDQTIKALPSALASMKSREFTTQMWADACTECGIEENSRVVLNQLFESGYVGQLSYVGGRTFVIHKYRDLNMYINYADRFHIHRGLWKALNLA